MKCKLKYSPDAVDKLKAIQTELTAFYGQAVTKRVLTKITGDIRKLQENPELGASVEAKLGILTPYRFLYTEQNYVFYRIENDTVYVTDIYHERENFMGRLLRVSLRTWESIDFWGE